MEKHEDSDYYLFVDGKFDQWFRSKDTLMDEIQSLLSHGKQFQVMTRAQWFDMTDRAQLFDDKLYNMRYGREEVTEENWKKLRQLYTEI